MELEQRKILYQVLKDFEGGIKSVSDTLKLTPDHVRNVMTRFERHKSVDLITVAVCAEIKKRQAIQKSLLKKNFPELV